MNALNRNFCWIIEYFPNVKQSKDEINTYILRIGKRDPLGGGVRLGVKKGKGVMAQLSPVVSDIRQSLSIVDTTLGSTLAAFTNSAKPQTL